MTILQDPNLTDVAPVLLARTWPKARLAPSDIRRCRRSAYRIGGGTLGALSKKRKVAAQLSQIARPYLSTLRQALGFALQFQPLILMGIVPGQLGDLLHEVKDASDFLPPSTVSIILRSPIRKSSPDRKYQQNQIKWDCSHSSILSGSQILANLLEGSPLGICA